MTKQQEDVVSFKKTPEGGLELEKREEEQEEHPKDEVDSQDDEVKSEQSSQKLGSSNRSFATVLGALSAMILGGALATYSIWFLYLHEKAVSYFPWNWLESTGISTATLLLIGIASSAVLIFVGVFLLFQKKKTKTIVSQHGTEPDGIEVVVDPPDPGEIFPRVLAPAPATTIDPQPHNEYVSWSFDNMEAELKRAKADTDSWVKYAKEGRQKQASLRLEMGKRVRDLKLTIPPVETPVKRPKKPKVVEPATPVIREPVPKMTKPVPVRERFDVDPEQAANLAAQK